MKRKKEAKLKRKKKEKIKVQKTPKKADA